MCLHLWVMLNTEERAGKWFRSSGYSTGNKITSKAGQMPMSRGRVRVGGDTDERQVIAYHDHEETGAGSHWPQGSRGFLVWFCDCSVGESQSGDCVVLLCSSWDVDCWDWNDAGGDTQQSDSRDSFRQIREDRNKRACGGNLEALTCETAWTVVPSTAEEEVDSFRAGRWWAFQ